MGLGRIWQGSDDYNACESFYSKYNSYFESSSPNIYNAVEVLMERQEEIFIMILGANNFLRKITGQRYLKKLAVIHLHKFDYDHWLITRYDFVKNVSTYYKIYVAEYNEN